MEEPTHCTAVVVVAGTASGVGKTSVAVGLMAALRERGLTVQAFKVGPDFIDPQHHVAATGRPSVNLDGWMLSREQALAAFRRHAVGADIAVVEGVMGLFDGRDGHTEAGSTAEMAKWLGAPVVLVLDCSAVARSAAAIVKGYQGFDPALRLEGLLFNHVGSAAHTTWLTDAMEASGVEARVLGGIPQTPGIAIPERHLGLHLPHDPTVPSDLAAQLGELVAAHVDLEGVLELAHSAEVPPQLPRSPPPQQQQQTPGGRRKQGRKQQQQRKGGSPQGKQQQGQQSLSPAGSGKSSPEVGAEEALPAGGDAAVVVAVARDAAFCFYYEDNLALLRAAGAELVFFSPLCDQQLPAGVAGVYIGGGYPEQYAAELAENQRLHACLRAFARAGGVVYAECGGLIYLSRSIQPQHEAPFPMVGIFPFKTVMPEGKMTMGYVEVETTEQCPLFPPGRKARGHVFHFSEIVQENVVGGAGLALDGKAAAAEEAWQTGYVARPQIPGAAEVAEGFCCRNVLASYVHLHFGSCPEFAAALVERCRSVDSVAAGAAAKEAGLLVGTASHQSSPQHFSKALRARSSPNFALDELAAAKHRASVEAHHRSYAEEGLRHPAMSLDFGGHGLPQQSSLSGMLVGGPRPLSPATTLSKVLSTGSLSNATAHSLHADAHALYAGGVVSPPLSASPQLSPRAKEMPHLHHPHAAAAAGRLPPPYYQHSRGGSMASLHGGSEQQMCSSFAQHSHLPLPQGGQQQQQPAGAVLPGCASWPHMQQGPTPGASWYTPPNTMAAAPPPPLGLGAAATPQLRPPRSASHDGFHPRSGQDSFRPGSGASRRYSLSPLNLSSMPPPLEAPQPSSLTATPYNWQHSHPPSDKIVSLSPAATEMLWALGLGGRVVAVSDVCNYPPEASQRAKARRSLADLCAAAGSDSSSTSAGSSSAALHAASGGGAAAAAGGGDAAPAAAAAATAGFQVDEQVLARERPGLIVYEDEPCSSGSSLGSGGAGSTGSSLCGSAMGQAVLAALVSVGLQHSCRVVCTRQHTLADVLDSMLVVAEAAGVADEAARTVDRLRTRLRRAAGEAARAAAALHRPRVLLLQSLRPLRTLGRWVPDVVQLAGGLDLLEQSGDEPQELTWDQVLASAPDVLIVAGLEGDSTLRPLTDLCHTAGLPGWWLLPAVKRSAVFVCDASLLGRGGPRLVEGVDAVARMLHGDAVGGACPERGVLKLSLRPGQRCRQRLLPSYFMTYA